VTSPARPAVERCGWIKDPLMERYHDQEWGVPVHDDRKHHEFLILDAFQAGLSWAIILKKREGFRAAFANFDPEKVARFTPGTTPEDSQGTRALSGTSSRCAAR